MVKTWLTGKDYLESDVWRCKDSPTGAHHWIEVTNPLFNGYFACKYCADLKKFPLTYTDVKLA